MDANKDEALKCIAIARSRLASGNKEIARKFVLKALRLYPSIDTSGLESLIGSRRSPSKDRKAEVPPATSTDPSNGAYDSDNQSTSSFTRAQAEAVRKVLACKDYYELLGVSKESTEDDIRRAYKSLALKFHPDKNRAPGATEAFKKIGTALNVLTNPEKRRRYDQFGTEEEQLPRPTRVRRHGDPFFQYDGDVFTMFFNGGFPFSQVYRGHRPPRSNESERENNYFIYVQLIPLLLIFVLSFFSNFFVQDPYYSLTESSKYAVKRLTTVHGVPYYVKHTFNHDFDGDITRLENQVEREFSSNLRVRCYREQEYKRSLLDHAIYHNDDAARERAGRLQLHSCERLVEVFGE